MRKKTSKSFLSKVIIAIAVLILLFIVVIAVGESLSRIQDRKNEETEA